MSPHRRKRARLHIRKHKILLLARRALSPAHLAWVDYILYRRRRNPYPRGSLKDRLYRHAFVQASIALHQLPFPRKPPTRKAP